MSLEQAFSSVQKEYLAGFFSGVNQRGGYNPFAGRLPDGTYTADAGSGVANLAAEEETVYGTTIEDLCKEERIKHELNGLDCYERIREAAVANELPEGGDMFRFKFYGLFNVSPAQESLMLRCRIPGGILKDYQMEGLAEMAVEWAGGYSDVTTRANIQLREIEPKNAINVLEKLVSIGLTSRGSGADNLRNITCSPTAGFDPDEIYDTSGLAKAMHHIILNTRELYGLPRKFNISFDGGGAISVCADTNDIAFYAVRVGEGEDAPPGVYFRVQLAGITGHKQFAADCGILLTPEQCIATATAMVRVFVENGDRSNRKKARLKYLIDKWGMEKFVDESEKKLDFDFGRLPLSSCETRRAIRRHGHVGAHPQSQEGFSYLGVSVPVGRLDPAQMKAVAQAAREFGNGEIRLTVWQNLLIPFVRNERMELLKEFLGEAGLTSDVDMIRSGLVACTGSRGCKFAGADTKGHAIELGNHLSSNAPQDQPINIHMTGCPHSCAQHYVGDIGMQAVKVKKNGESVEGYNIVIGGGVDNEQGIAEDFVKGVAFEDAKPVVENLLNHYRAVREENESFVDFARRSDIGGLAELAQTGIGSV